MRLSMFPNGECCKRLTVPLRDFPPALHALFPNPRDRLCDSPFHIPFVQKWIIVRIPLGNACVHSIRARYERGIILYTKQYLLSNEASELSHSIDRVPLPQNQLQLINPGVFLTMLENHLGVKVMGDVI